MTDPFKLFRFDQQMCVGSLACPVWDNCLLRVFVPFGMRLRPVERQIRIARQLAFPRESIRVKTEAAIFEALSTKHSEANMGSSGAFPLPDIWIPPSHNIKSSSDDAFVLVFERLLNEQFQGVVVVDGWKFGNVEVVSRC